jgi:hypothetical protein
MRRIAYALFVLAGLSVVIAVISFGFAVNEPTTLRARALGYGMVNVAFAVVNAMLGLLLLVVSRPA